ncbi:MAG: carboxypeptidase-like regulatory domain-containing protein [Thermodesulfobacteriota bacterium]
MRYTLICSFLVVLVGMVGLPGGSQADADTKSPVAGMGTLSGRVTLGPLSPVEGPGSKPARVPASGVKLLVYGPARQEMATVETDKEGRFRIDLPPGSYQVEMGPKKGKEFTKDLPATVTITGGRETRLDIRLDTGMR